MKNFTYLFKKNANTPPYENKGASHADDMLTALRSIGIGSARLRVLAVIASILMAFTFGVGNAWGGDATTIFYESFGSTSSNTSLSSYTGYSATTTMFSTSGNVNTHYSGSGSVGKNNLSGGNLSSGYTGASGLSGCYHVGTANTAATIIQISNINISGYSSLHLSFGALGGNTNHKINVTYKIDNGSETNLITNGSITNSNWNLKEADITGTGSSLTIYFKHTPTKAWTIRLDDIKLTGVSSSPQTVSLYNGANGATEIGDYTPPTALPTTAAAVAGWTFDGNWSKILFSSKSNDDAYATGTYFAGGATSYSGANLYAIYRRTPTVGSTIYSTQPAPGYTLSLNPATGNLSISADKDLAFIPVGASVTLSAMGGLVTEWTVIDNNGEITPTSSSNTSFVFDMPASDVVAEATMCALPAVPSNLAASLHADETRGKTIFSWTAGSGATKYTLTYTKAGADPVVVENIASTSFTVNSLGVGSYTWSVKSVNTCGESSAVDGTAFTICPDFAAITPTVSATTNITQTTATANWTAVDNAAKYTVQVYNGETMAAEYTNVIATTNAITGLTANTTYIVKVTAFNACDEASLVGASASFTTPKNVYTVTFNANGGSIETGQAGSVDVTDGDATTLPSSGFTKAGFSLSGWKVDNEGDLIAKGASYTVTSAVTLYAQWSPNTITVTYKPNDGSETDDVVENFTYGEDYNVNAANTFSREGYQFKHWNNAADGEGAVTLAAGAAYTGTENIELYAIWDQLYTVNWIVNSKTKSSQTAIAGTALDEPYVPVLADCDNSRVFVGWTTATYKDYEDEDDAPGELFVYANTMIMPSGGANYYAVFANEEETKSTITKTYGWEDADDASCWTITDVIAKTSGQGATGTYAGKINTNHTYVTFNSKVNVTNFSFKLKRTSNNSNYNVYVETSTDNSTWTAAETYTMGTFSNGSYTSGSKDFDGKTALYVRFHCYNTTAVRYVDDVSITYNGTITTHSNYITTCCKAHSISVSDAIEHGSVSVNPSESCEGKPIVLTSTPDEGYEFDAWEVSYVDSESASQTMTVTDNEFTMPDYDVTVSATFNKIAVTGVTINGLSNVQKDENITLTLDITPEEARPTIVWSSSNTSVATVDAGVVTGVAVGEATITATVDGTGYTKDITVTAPTELSSIEVVSPKTTYSLNEAFVAPTINGSYVYVSDKQPAYTQTIEGATFTGFDNQNASAQTVTVSYGGKSTTYDITVSPWTLNLQTKKMYGNDAETPEIEEVTVNSIESAIDLTSHYKSGLCDGYEQIGYIASSADVDALPNDLLTSYTPSADNETLYGVFKKTNYEGKTMVNEDFSSITTTVTNAEISVDNFDWLNSKSKVYPNTGEVKLGSGSAIGSLTTEAFDLSHAFVVKLKAKQYDSDEKTIQVTVGSESKSVMNLTTSMAEYTFNFDAATSSSQVIISTTSSSYRAYVDDIQIYTLDDVEYMSVYDCREEKSITYNVVSDQATWTACEDATVLEGKSYTICANEPSLHGYDFGGWIVNDDEENILAAGAQITVDDNIALTAKWTAHVYDYHYDLSASATNGSITSVMVNGVPTALADVELHDGDVVVVTATANENYEFESWSHSNNVVFSNEGSVATFTINDGAGDVTVAANFTEKTKYTITLNVFGRTYTTKQGYVGATYSSVIGDTESPAVDGYLFQGWSTTEADNTDALISGEEILTADVTLYAIIGISTPTGYVYNKVTSMEDVTADGYYLIVNEAANKAFDGSRNSSDDLNANSNNVNVEVNESQIISNTEIDAAVVTIGTIQDNDSLYIKTSTGYYIGNNGSNGLLANKNIVYRNALSFIDGNFVVNSGKKQDDKDMVLQFNSGAGNGRFGYYKGTQNAIQLYKRGEVHEDVLPEVEPTMEISTEVTASTAISGGYAGNMIIYTDGTFDANQATEVKDLIIHTTLGKGTGTTTTGNAPGASGQIFNANNLTAKGDVYLEIELTQESAASAGWYAFSVPFQVDALNGVYYGETKLQNEVGYAIMSYHGDLRANGEYGWKKYRGIMQPGVLYLITVGDTDYKTLRFKKVAGATIAANSQVAVSDYPSDVSTNAAWNGIGNPNLAISNLSTPVPTMQFYDHKTNSFIGRNHSVNLVVGSAFFIQYNAGSTVSIPVGTTGNNGYLAPKRERRTIENEIFEVSLINGMTEETEDNVFIAAREDATSTYEIGHDVAKMSMGTAKCAQMYIPAYGTNLCAAEFPLVGNTATFPLTITAPAAGNYSLSTAASSDAEIYLTYNDAIIWNLSMSPYDINLSQGTTNGYGLRLITAPKTTTDVENVQCDQVQCTKVIIDEHVFILRGGQMYDLNGKMVK